MDTSGSMSKKMLGVCKGEVTSVVGTLARGGVRPYVRVYTCDMKASEAQEVYSGADVRLIGGGGTDLTVVAIQDPGDTAAGTVYAVSSTVAHLGPSSSGLAATDIDSSSFRFFDYVWRLRRQNGITKNEPLRCALYVNDAAKTVAGALDDLMRQTFGYWYANREGRIALGVPDFLASSLLTNGGFELDGTSLWPWRAYSPASGAVTTAAAYNGTRSATVTSAGNAQAALRQQVTIPRPGVYVATAMVALSTGSSVG
jgi:hypothetical protein